MSKEVKVDSKKILTIFTFCILILVPFLKVFSMLLQNYNILSNYDFINPAIVLYISAPFLLFIYFYNLYKTKRKLDIYDYLFYMLFIVGIIVCITSINKVISIFGKDFRHEGFLSLLSYYLTFINWKNYANKEDIIKFKKLIYLIGFVNSIYVILQIYTTIPGIVRFSSSNMSSGLCGNPNFLGSLIVTILSMITSEFLLYKEKNNKKIILLILLFISLINCQSTGPFLAYIISIIFIIIYLILKKSICKKNILILFIILPLIYISIRFINVYEFKKNNVSDRNELSVESIKQTVNTGGTYRLTIWQYTLEVVEDNLLMGVGYDNLMFAYPHQDYKKLYTNTFVIGTSEGIKNNKVDDKDISNKVGIVDNAHNIYLHMLASGGLLTLIPYLLLCLLTFIKGLKSKNKLMFILLSGFVAYSIQGFANISVIQVAPIYFLIIGLMLSIKE